jgi:hypothetical protein
MNYEELGEQPPAVLDQLPVEVLVNLKEQAEQHLASASQMVAVLHGVFTRRYAAGLNDTGTHKRVDGGYEIKITVPKTVAWDQEQLTKAVDTIKGWGEDPAEYVETKLNVSETKFKAWPSAIRDLFAPARTTKAGKPKFEVAVLKQEAA